MKPSRKMMKASKQAVYRHQQREGERISRLRGIMPGLNNRGARKATVRKLYFRSPLR